MHLARTFGIVVFVNITASQRNGNKMHLKHILNQVEKQKGFVYQSAEFSADKESILIQIRARIGSRPICSGCGSKRTVYDRLRERRFEFVPLWGIVVYFV